MENLKQDLSKSVWTLFGNSTWFYKKDKVKHKRQLPVRIVLKLTARSHTVPSMRGNADRRLEQGSVVLALLRVPACSVTDSGAKTSEAAACTGFLA